MVLKNYNQLFNHSALHLYGEDGTWSLLGYRIFNSISDDNRNRPITTFSFYLARRHSFYLVSFIVPVIMLSVTSCLVFALPADAGEKMGTSITVLLAFAVYLTIVTEYLPDTSLQISWISLYLTVLLGICALSVVLTTWILHIYHYPENHPVGSKMTSLTRFLQGITCFSSKAESQESQAHDAELENWRFRESNLDLTNLAYVDEEAQGDQRHETIGNGDAKNSTTVNYRGSRGNKHRGEEEHEKEPLDWKIVSKTFDWFFYLLFSTIVLLLTVGYMTAICTHRNSNIRTHETHMKHKRSTHETHTEHT